MEIRVVVYARCSSDKQAEKDMSIPAQIKELKKYAKKHNMIIVREFIDEAQSALSGNRPAFQEMISIAKKKEKTFDAILVWKLSRFARNREDSVIFKGLLKKREVQVIAITQPIDDSPSGKLLEGMIEVIDEFYSNNLAQDTIRGMKENAERGFRNGGIAPIGYKTIKIQDGNNKRNKLEPDEVYAPIIKRIFDMYITGKGAKEIVKVLNNEGLKTNRNKPWSKNSIYYILKNKVYIGTTIFNSQNKNRNKGVKKIDKEVVIVENTHPPLVDKEVFNKVQQIIENRKPDNVHPRILDSQYMLSGLIYCKKCGSKLIGTSAKSSRFFYYTCWKHLKCGKSICSSKAVPKVKIENFIVSRIQENILTEKNITLLYDLVQNELVISRSENKNKLQSVLGKIKDINNRLNNLYNALETGKNEIDILSPRIRQYNKQKEILENQKHKIEFNNNDNDELSEISINSILSYIKDLKAILDKGSNTEKKNFIKSFVKRIETNKNEVDIEYSLPIKKKTEPLYKEVLSMVQFCSSARTRTADLVVNSHPLYQLSYRGMMYEIYIIFDVLSISNNSKYKKYL